MIDAIQIPTLYLIAFIGITCGFAALFLSILAYTTARQNNRFLKAVCQNIETLLAKKETTKAEKEHKKTTLEKTLRELEHDHDRIKDALDIQNQSLLRIEGIARKVKENQYEYIKNNVGSSKNNIKVLSPGAPKTPDGYQTDMINALLSQIVDRMQHQPGGTDKKDPG